MPHSLAPILTNTYTVDDAYRRLNLAQECLEDFFYHNDNKSNESLRSFILSSVQKKATPQDVTALTQWDEIFWSSFQAQSFQDVLHALEEAVEQLPIMTLYVPVSLDEAGLAMLGTWCRENVNQDILLEVLVDPHTTGGCAFVHNDVYHDFSLHHFFANKRGVVSNLLRSYD